MTQEFFFGNYLAYPRCIKVAVGQEIDLNVNNNPQPVGPKDNEIWYWGEYYDLANAISILGQQFPYEGPAIVSNEKIGDKYVITFNGPVTELGIKMTGDETGELYPVFVNISDMGISCNITRIEIPNSVTRIGADAFYGCSGLTSVTCEAINPPTLGGDVFFNTSNQLKIYVPSQSIDAYKAATNWSTYAGIIQAIQ